MNRRFSEAAPTKLATKLISAERPGIVRNHNLTGVSDVAKPGAGRTVAMFAAAKVPAKRPTLGSSHAGAKAPAKVGATRKPAASSTKPSTSKYTQSSADEAESPKPRTRSATGSATRSTTRAATTPAKKTAAAKRAAVKPPARRPTRSSARDTDDEEPDFVVDKPAPRRAKAAPASAGPVSSRTRTAGRIDGMSASSAPRPRKPAVEVVHSPEVQAAMNLAIAIAVAAIDKKAIEPAVIEVAGRVDYADYLVFLSGRSDRHVVAISDAVEAALLMQDPKRKPSNVEGRNAGIWVVLDFGDVVAHVFQEDTRKFYDLDVLWAEARRVPVPGAPTPVMSTTTSAPTTPTT